MRAILNFRRGFPGLAEALSERGEGVAVCLVDFYEAVRAPWRSFGLHRRLRRIGAPLVALYGPGSATLFGPGRFWREIPHRAVIEEPFPCRDQQTVFKRVVPWARRCQRNTNECLLPRCMLANPVERVVQAVRELIPDLIREQHPGVETRALDVRR